MESHFPSGSVCHVTGRSFLNYPEPHMHSHLQTGIELAGATGVTEVGDAIH